MSARSRRDFLRARQPDPQPRLPWAVENWTDHCTRCGDCIKACEEAILVEADGGFPTIDFSLGGCSQCGACVSVCQSGVFEKTSVLWPQTLRITDQCLPKQGVYCQSCRDGCEPQAISFLIDRSIPQPIIDPEKCTACGMCISTCPTQAFQWSSSS